MKNKASFILFLIALFIIKFPPIYISPFATKFLTSHIIAKVILTLTIFTIIISKKNTGYLNSYAIVPPLLFFFSQTISLFGATDILFYLKDYQNLITALFIFIGAFVYSQDKKFMTIITPMILITGTLVILFDSLYFLFAPQFLTFISAIVEKEAFPVYSVNLQRDRFNLYLNTELFLPYFLNLLLLTTQHKHNKLFLLVPIFLITFLAFISNFRHRLLLLLFVFISYALFMLYSKYLTKKLLISFLGIFILAVISSLFITRTSFQRDIINRLLLEDKIEDIKSMNSRVDNLRRAVEYFHVSPIIGVGLGNYQLYNKDVSKFSSGNSDSKMLSSQSTSDPHSIISKTISESGIFGLICLCVMIVSFLRKDYVYVKNKPTLPQFAFIVSYWGLFTLSLITPSITLFRGGWMWFMRGIVEGQISQYERNHHAKK